MLAAEPICTPIRSFGGSFVKLEYRQVGGSYKIRGLHELLRSLPEIPPRIRVLSAGNMARSLLLLAGKNLQRPIQVFVPDSIPHNKERALRELGAELHKVPMSELWSMVEKGNSTPTDELLVHPVDCPPILKGYSRIADEIIAEAPSIEEVVIPFGVGGLLLGIAPRLRKLAPRVKIIAVESARKHPLYSALTGEPNPAEASWVDAIGTPSVLPRVLARIQNENLIDDIRRIEPEPALTLARNYFAATGDRIEGAAALALAAAPRRRVKSIALLSGGNVNPELY